MILLFNAIFTISQIFYQDHGKTQGKSPQHTNRRPAHLFCLISINLPGQLIFLRDGKRHNDCQNYDQEEIRFFPEF